MPSIQEKELYPRPPQESAESSSTTVGVSTGVEQGSPLPQEIPGASEIRPIPEQKQPGVSASTARPIPAPPTAVATAPAPKTSTRKEIEDVLSDGLSALYQSMTPDEQRKFRAAGEVAAATIEELLTTFKATARKVLDIIRSWLAMIPRVNTFFLEQESKLKADKILSVQRRLKKEHKLKSLHQ